MTRTDAEHFLWILRSWVNSDPYSVLWDESDIADMQEELVTTLMRLTGNET